MFKGNAKPCNNQLGGGQEKKESTKNWWMENGRTHTALPSEEPVIVRSQTSFQIGDMLTFTCVSCCSNPPVNLTWILNDDTVSHSILHQDFFLHLLTTERLWGHQFRCFRALFFIMALKKRGKNDFVPRRRWVKSRSRPSRWRRWPTARSTRRRRCGCVRTRPTSATVSCGCAAAPASPTLTTGAAPRSPSAGRRRIAATRSPRTNPAAPTVRYLELYLSLPIYDKLMAWQLKKFVPRKEK